MTFARTRLAAITTCLLTALLVLAGRPASAAPADPLADAFARAAAAYDVPRDLLVALAYAETHLDGHGGKPSASGGYGVMHLVSNPTTHTLEKAAELTGEAVKKLRTDEAANVLGGAAVLRSLADGLGLDEAARKDAGRWYQAVAEYGNASTPEVARLYADAVYDLLGRGIQAAGVQVAPQEVQADRGAYAQARDLSAQAASPDYPNASWVAASSSNYTASSRPSSYAIDRVVIHVTQGSYAGTISWFQNPSASVSAHYVVRSSDGAVTQMVRDKDVAWHAGNWSYNTRSIGIEHEGYVSDASWFTDAMYRASAALTRSICDKYGIPKDRTHIIGHNQVPGATHTDPGQYWDWNKYMQYVTGGGGTSWSVTVDNTTAGKFTASANWGTSTYSGQRYGTDYRFADPVAASDPAWYRAAIPSAGTYRVEAWYPADPGYNSSAPYIVATSGGNQTVYVDQRSGGGGWRNIGTFSLNAGDYNVVGVSRWTSGVGYVIADAVRITRL
ncbi:MULTISPECIES: golvesin C-terminal-like domain-containing protein [Streptosporangium]|uniref:N-acetylmuramoyl-L-alanine amidase n=1 Tax=Streptosporangium brasiliense TaxID=47480 RepID=A0ABT9REX6_9ACTN|nr:N-acetylmuramoyl-L-alanine amidase [Streptosporangium brasiliense]MDP9867810.1 N-acetyl-anhydromuramyl-L-alanine amidase AmpD [Streptosporangium brasiliense]